MSLGRIGEDGYLSLTTGEMQVGVPASLDQVGDLNAREVIQPLCSPVRRTPDDPDLGVLGRSW